MTKIRLPTTDARIEQGVRAGLEAAVVKLRTTCVWSPYESGSDVNNAWLSGAVKSSQSGIEAIRAIAADPDAVARIAKGASDD